MTRTIDLEELAAMSGDSSLVAVRFDDAVVTIELDLDDDSRAELSFETDTFYSALDRRGQPFNHGFLQLVDLSESTNTENGYYIPPTTFAEMMDQSSKHFQLVWGRKVTEVRFILYYRSGSIVFAAPLGGPADVSCRLVS